MFSNYPIRLSMSSSVVRRTMFYATSQ